MSKIHDDHVHDYSSGDRKQRGPLAVGMVEGRALSAEDVGTTRAQHHDDDDDDTCAVARPAFKVDKPRMSDFLGHYIDISLFSSRSTVSGSGKRQEQRYPLQEKLTRKKKTSRIYQVLSPTW